MRKFNEQRFESRLVSLHQRGDVVLIKRIADHLFQERARLLRSESTPIATGKLSAGRLLICYPEESAWDGASEAASQEFIDVGDIPAWDTWCYYATEDGWMEPAFFIVSWVPPGFIELAQDGIDVNPVDCIRWASQVNNAFTHALRAEELLL